MTEEYLALKNLEIPVRMHLTPNPLFPTRRMGSVHAPLTRHGRDYNHAFGQIHGQQQMDQLINQCLDKLYGEAKQEAMDAFERTLTQEDKKWDYINREYQYKSVRGRWNHFMLAWCMAKGLI